MKIVLDKQPNIKIGKYDEYINVNNGFIISAEGEIISPVKEDAIYRLKFRKNITLILLSLKINMVPQKIKLNR
jgi:hypothetical protein